MADGMEQMVNIRKILIYYLYQTFPTAVQKFALQLFFKIVGIGSASGLVFKDHTLFVISDNGGYVYQYDIGKNELQRHPILSADTLENIPKNAKPDFEALLLYDDTLYALGSGSTKNRNRMMAMDTATKKVKETDLSVLYASMQQYAGLPADQFNIEGAVRDGDTWYFFQRGNGMAAKNGVFTVRDGIPEGAGDIRYQAVELPKIGGVRATFTDAIHADAKIYFLATAENTESTYHDGEILGSLVGALDPATMKVLFTMVISTHNKFEGLTIYSSDEKTISFLLCEDGDSQTLESAIYKLTLHR
jgi:hypothetical protein